MKQLALLFRAVLVAMALSLTAAPAFAVMPDEILDDPALEARARAISQEIRCLVCQNQSIDDSNADLARDLRLLVRERLVAGDSNEEVIGYIVSRYGEFVLLKPRFNLSTLALWGTPVVVLLAGLGFALVAVRRRSAGTQAKGLTPEEEAALAEAMGEGAGRGQRGEG